LLDGIAAWYVNHFIERESVSESMLVRLFHIYGSKESQHKKPDAKNAICSVSVIKPY